MRRNKRELDNVKVAKAYSLTVPAHHVNQDSSFISLFSEPKRSPQCFLLHD